MFLATRKSDLLTDQHRENIHQILLIFREKKKIKQLVHGR
jgi:hypothetical protein